MSTVPGAAVAGTTTQVTNTSNGSNNTNAQLSLASNFNTFLNLLTTQLQHQDPSNPVDSNQFTQQLVAFAGVQQQVEGNTYLKQLLGAIQGNQVGSASSYIGTTVKSTGNSGALVNGSASFGYSLPSAASDVQVTIKDSGGNTVFKGTGTGKAGDNSVTWDGKSSFTGVSQSDGIYNITITAKDSVGNTIPATTYTTGTVQSASINNGVVMLDLGGGLQVATTDVTNISNLPGASTSSSNLSQQISDLSNKLASLL